MSEWTEQKAHTLIKLICCNYERSTGGCLLRDSGVMVQCPQLYAQSIVCRYFRDVLLNDPEGQPLRDTLMMNDYIYECENCGRRFRGLAKQVRLCAKCAATMNEITNCARSPGAKPKFERDEREVN